MAQTQLKPRMLRVIAGLKKEFPEAKIRLNFNSPYELLVATILSAQCTDDRVNIVTPALFKKYPGPREMAAAPIGKIQELVRSTGFYQAKSLSIKESSIAIVRDHGGEVPRTIEQLVRLRGVGRKTANVVLGNAFGRPGIVVDRHFARVTGRMGFTKS
ncbi:MAG: endonuclease III, partial [Bdellovibrionales bacterium RIFOXYD1_FULL_53_11]